MELEEAIKRLGKLHSAKVDIEMELDKMGNISPYDLKPIFLPYELIKMQRHKRLRDSIYFQLHATIRNVDIETLTQRIMMN
jgi:hypothetical protein